MVIQLYYFNALSQLNQCPHTEQYLQHEYTFLKGATYTSSRLGNQPECTGALGVHGGNSAIPRLMLTYCSKVCTHPRPRHLPQDMAEPGREEKAQERAGGVGGVGGGSGTEHC